MFYLGAWLPAFFPNFLRDFFHVYPYAPMYNNCVGSMLKTNYELAKERKTFEGDFKKS